MAFSEKYRDFHKSEDKIFGIIINLPRPQWILNLKDIDGLHQGSQGVSSSAVVGDGRDFVFEQKTFVKVRVGLSHVIDLTDDSIHRAVGDDHDPSRVD